MAPVRSGDVDVRWVRGWGPHRGGYIGGHRTGATPFARGEAAIKFNSFWTIELEPDWSLFATHPVNRDDLPFRTISGLVDADRFHDGGINFPAIWTRPDFSGVNTELRIRCCRLQPAENCSCVHPWP